jgi:hypothetical protein
MSFDAEGFTGESAASIRREQLEKYAELFTFAKACSKLAVDITHLLPDSEDRMALTSRLFFARCTSHFQAAVCLAEGGMTIEAMVLCRSLIETFFVLNALAEGVVTPAELLSHDGASKKSHANALLNRKGIYPAVGPHEEELKSFVAEKAGANEIKLFDFAQKGKALAAYDGLYRTLSHHAAHPSLSAVDPYLVESSDRVHVQFRPIVDHTPRAIISACIGILMCCFACDKLGARTPETNEIGARLWEEFMALNSAYDPWAEI